MFCASCGTDQISAPLCDVCGPAPVVASRYRLERSVAPCAEVPVFEGLRLSDGQKVCVRVYRCRAEELLRIEELKRRGEHLKQLQHPGVARVIDARYDEAVERFYMVEEWIDSVGSLRELGAEAWGVRAVLELLDGLLASLAAAHSLSPPALHWGVRPSRILRPAHGDGVVLVGFEGLATAPGAVQAGAYCAPEQRFGHATVRSDLYACGVVALSLLSDIAVASLRERAAGLSWHDAVPFDVQNHAWLSALLEPAPADRPADAECARDLLRTALANMPDEVREPAATEAPEPIGAREGEHGPLTVVDTTGPAQMQDAPSWLDGPLGEPVPVPLALAGEEEAWSREGPQHREELLEPVIEASLEQESLEIVPSETPQVPQAPRPVVAVEPEPERRVSSSRTQVLMACGLGLGLVAVVVALILSSGERRARPEAKSLVPIAQDGALESRCKGTACEVGLFVPGLDFGVSLSEAGRAHDAIAGGRELPGSPHRRRLDGVNQRVVATIEMAGQPMPCEFSFVPGEGLVRVSCRLEMAKVDTLRLHSAVLADALVRQYGGQALTRDSSFMTTRWRWSLEGSVLVLRADELRKSLILSHGTKAYEDRVRALHAGERQQPAEGVAPEADESR